MQAFWLGVLQGGTEFLPVSSSGHLALAQSMIPGLSGPILLFDVVVHLGTVLAIVILLRTRVARLVRAGLSLLPGGPAADEGDRRWALLIVAGSVPTAVIGLLLRDTTEALLHRPDAVGLALVGTAVLLFASERIGRRSRSGGELGVRDALWMGAAQGLAVIPGISRSGSTVAAALARNVRGDVAVEFSLLLSIPAILGAGLLVAVESASELEPAHLAPLLVGFAAALGTGMLAVKALQWAVTQRRLLPFAVYCACVGAGAMILG